MSDFQPHSDKQEDLIFSDEELTLGVTGTQWGKSQGGSLWFKRMIHTYADGKSNFIIAAPTYKILGQSALPYFLRTMEGVGTYNSSKAEFTLHIGGVVYARSGTDPDSVVGIPDVKAVWLDEAGKCSLYFSENIRARAASKGAKKLFTTSPYSLNWIYKDLIKPIKDGLITDVPLIQAASWENPYHALSDPDRLARERMRMDPRRFNMIYGGEFGRMMGLVYDCFDDDENIIDQSKVNLPTGTRFFAGVDWGFTEPFSMGIRAVTSEGLHYKVSEFYKTGLTVTDMVTYARQQMQVWGIEVFYCDPSQPGLIEEFCRNGLPAVAADNDIRRGIDLHYELIKTRKFKIFRNTCPYTLDEIDSYHYPEPKDLGPDESIKDQKPVGQNDHALDADRYCTIMTYKTGTKHTPKVPSVGNAKKNESAQQRIARLKKTRSTRHSENW